MIWLIQACSTRSSLGFRSLQDTDDSRIGRYGGDILIQYCAVSGGTDARQTIAALNEAQQRGNWRVQCYVPEGSGWFLLERQIGIEGKLAAVRTWFEPPPPEGLRSLSTAFCPLAVTYPGRLRIIGFFYAETPGVEVLSPYDAIDDQEPDRTIVIGFGHLKDAVRDITCPPAVPVFTWQQRRFAGLRQDGRAYLVELGEASRSGHPSVRAIVAAGLEDLKMIPVDLSNAWQQAEISLH